MMNINKIKSLSFLLIIFLGISSCSAKHDEGQDSKNFAESTSYSEPDGGKTLFTFVEEGGSSRIEYVDTLIPDVPKSISDFILRMDSITTKNLESSDILLWDLIWPGKSWVRDANVVCYIKGEMTKDKFNFNNLKLQDQDSVYSFDIENLFKLANNGDIGSWEELNKITDIEYSIVRSLTPLRVVAFDPYTDSVILTNGNENVLLSFVNMAKYIEFWPILLEFYIKMETSYNASLNTIHNDSKAQEWLSNRFEQVYKERFE